jgi:hypothetical protein
VKPGAFVPPVAVGDRDRARIIFLEKI